MTGSVRETLLRQFDTAWALAEYHLKDLSDEECMWRPGGVGPHIHRQYDGAWRADWPEREGYDAGPPSIGWILWHLGFWWSMAIDHSFGDGALSRDRFEWRGEADDATTRVRALAIRWRSHIEPMSAEDFHSAERSRWPFSDRPFADIAAWANLELMKNASEIGYCRFLFAAAQAPQAKKT